MINLTEEKEFQTAVSKMAVQASIFCKVNITLNDGLVTQWPEPQQAYSIQKTQSEKIWKETYKEERPAESIVCHAKEPDFVEEAQQQHTHPCHHTLIWKQDISNTEVIAQVLRGAIITRSIFFKIITIDIP